MWLARQRFQLHYFMNVARPPGKQPEQNIIWHPAGFQRNGTHHATVKSFFHQSERLIGTDAPASHQRMIFFLRMSKGITLGTIFRTGPHTVFGYSAVAHDLYDITSKFLCSRAAAL
jgi:hypothetical protein